MDLIQKLYRPADGLLDAFTSTFTPVQQGIGKFGQSLDSLENIARSIQQASGNITGAADISNQSMSNLAGTVTQITENLTPIQDLLNVINLSLKKLMNHRKTFMGQENHSISCRWV